MTRAPRNVLVTGGAGFIGSHLADRYIAEGDRVVIIDDLSTGKRANLPPAAEFHEIEIQSPEAREVIATGRFDIIAHMAGQMDVRVSVAEPIRDAHINIIGSLNLLEAVRSIAPEDRPRIVFASTGGVLYGEAAGFPTSELVVPQPDCPYGVSKVAVEYYLNYYARVWGIDSVALRFGNVYGPRQDLHGEAGVTAIFTERILRGEGVTIFGDGKQTRDFIYVSDIADAFYVAAGAARGRRSEPVPTFNIGTGIEISVLDLARLIGEAVGVTPAISFAPHRPGEIPRSFLTTEKATAALGWKAAVSIREGLARTIAWARATQSAGKTAARPMES